MIQQRSRSLAKIEEGYDIVSGWRSHRIDNLLLRKIPSRCANWLMAKLSGVNIHDFGTTFKAYRGDLLRQLPLYGEMHRFIPALASAYGAAICEIPIQNNHRKHGESHYNISRTFRVFFDLMTIRFLLRYMSRPLHFFGRLGVINMGFGSAVALWLLVWKVLTRTDVVQQHGLLLVFAAVLILVGLQLVALGLLGELNVWQYFNPSARKPYALSEVLDLHANRRIRAHARGGFMRTPQTKRGNPETVRTSARPSSHERLSSSVTALVIEQALAELGVHARLSDIVRGVRLIESAIIQSRSRRKPEHLC